MAIKVITDSTAYLTKEFIQAYDIKVVSLNVILGGECLRELDLSNETFYKQMDSVKEVPTSSQPTPDELFTAFEQVVAEGNSVIGIFLSSEMSGTYANTHLVKEMVLEKYPEATIELLDSRSNCMQMGFVAIAAAKAARAGKTMAEVLKVAEKVIDNSRFIFTPETLDYLQKGGRIGGAAALLGNILQLKPILTVSKGKTDVLTKVRTKKKAVATLVGIFLEDLENRELEDIIVHHINCEDEGTAIANRLAETLGRPVGIQSIGPVIGLHVGPGSIGLAYHTKEKN